MITITFFQNILIQTLHFCSGSPLQVEDLCNKIFRVCPKSGDSSIEKGIVDQFYTPNLTCYKTITSLTGNFYLINILLHSHKIVPLKGEPMNT